MGFNVKQMKARQKFYEEFSAKISDKILDVDMAELRAQKFIYDELKLTPAIGQQTIWGLVVFCEHGLYFHVAPSENYFTAMIRAASNAEPPKEQTIALHSIQNIRAALPRGNFFSRFSYEHVHCVDFSFTAQNGSEYPFSIIFGKKAESVFGRIKNYIGK